MDLEGIIKEIILIIEENTIFNIQELMALKEVNIVNIVVDQVMLNKILINIVLNVK